MNDVFDLKLIPVEIKQQMPKKDFLSVIGLFLLYVFTTLYYDKLNNEKYFAAPSESTVARYTIEYYWQHGSVLPT